LTTVKITVIHFYQEWCQKNKLRRLNIKFGVKENNNNMKYFFFKLKWKVLTNVSSWLGNLYFYYYSLAIQKAINKSWYSTKLSLALFTLLKCVI
jgi:hypothetical protein